MTTALPDDVRHAAHGDQLHAPLEPPSGRLAPVPELASRLAAVNQDRNGLPDGESAEWVRDLRQSAPQRDAAVGRLHALLLRVAQRELRRRSDRNRIRVSELDDLAHQATANAIISITAKLDQFRYESQFTTWAFRFVILEVSNELGHHFWRAPHNIATDDAWERLLLSFGFGLERQAEWQELVVALRTAIDVTLTPYQRGLFVAIVLNGVPLDALVAKLDSNRNAIYEALFDARRKLRQALAANGYLALDPSGPP